MDLLDAGCPVGRHELTDPEWIAMGILKAERQRLIREKVEAANGKAGQ